MSDPYIDKVQVGGTTYNVTDTNAETEIVNLKSALEQLDTATAKTSGDYPELTSGTAGQMLSNNGVTDKVPYVYRKSGGEGADRAKECITGGTVCWNQLAMYSGISSPVDAAAVTFTKTSNGEWEFTGTPNATVINFIALNLIKDHIYIVKEKSVQNAWAVKYGTFYRYGSNYDGCRIIKPTSDSSNYIGLEVPSANVSISGKFTPQIFDLTQMFGSTIADYIYGLETVTTGAGVAWFKSLFPKSYYAYNSGTLMSVQAASKKTVGKNQIPDGTDTGKGYLSGKYLAITGVTVNNTGWNVSEYFGVLPGAQYVYSNTMGKTSNNCAVCFYDGDKNFIEGISYSTCPLVVTTPANAAYARMSFYADANANGLMMLEIGAAATEYEPYEAHTYPLDSSLTLRGIPKLDANNSLYYDGDTYEADGAVTRKYGTATFNGGSSESWTLDSSAPSGYYRFYISKGDMRRANYATGESYKNIMICDKCEVVSDHGIVSPQSTYCITGYRASASPTTNWVYFLIKNDQGVTDASTLKTWLASHPITIVYQLKASTTEAADPFQPVMLLNEYGTEEFIDAGVTASTPTRDVSIPVGHDTWYPQNSRAKLDGLPSNFSTLIAPTEATYKATQNYSSGDLFIVNNVLYKATANIANAGTITPGTNCTATTLAAVIAAIA